MHQYGMNSYYLDVVVADFSYPLWRTDLRIDAIITDREYKKKKKSTKSLIINCSNFLKFVNYLYFFL